MALSDWGAIALIVIALVNLGMLAGMGYLVFVVRSQLKFLAERVEPAMHEVQSTLAMVKETASDVSKRVETISEHAEQLAADVTARAERVTNDVTQRADHISAGVTDRFDRVSADFANRANHIFSTGELLVERIAQRVDTTTAVVEEAVARPLVGLAGVRAGVRKGLEVWHSLQQASGRRQREREEAAARRMIEATPATAPVGAMGGEAPAATKGEESQ